MNTKTATHITGLGAEFHRAAKDADETIRHIDEARKDRILFLRQCSTDNTARLAKLKDEIRTLPEQIAKWDAEAAKLESQTAEDLLRLALEPARQAEAGKAVPAWFCPGCVIEIELGETFGHCSQCGKPLVLNPRDSGTAKPEPFRAGLPPERLRKVWAEWEKQAEQVGQHGFLVRFFGERGERYEFAKYPGHHDPVDAVPWNGSYRPRGATWAHVEAMADEAERAADAARPLPYRCGACGKVWSLNDEEGRLCYCGTERPASPRASRPDQVDPGDGV